MWDTSIYSWQKLKKHFGFYSTSWIYSSQILNTNVLKSVLVVTSPSARWHVKLLIKQHDHLAGVKAWSQKDEHGIRFDGPPELLILSWMFISPPKALPLCRFLEFGSVAPRPKTTCNYVSWGPLLCWCNSWFAKPKKCSTTRVSQDRPDLQFILETNLRWANPSSTASGSLETCVLWFSCGTAQCHPLSLFGMLWINM